MVSKDYPLSYVHYILISFLTWLCADPLTRWPAVEDSEEAYIEDMKMIYDELKGNAKNGLSIEKYKQWEEYEVMENDGVTDDFILQEVLMANGVTKQFLTFDQFKAVTEELQNNYDDIDESGDDNDDDDAITATASSKDIIDDEDEDDENENNEEDEQSYEDALQEAFNELKGKDGKVTVKAFKEWEEVKGMLDDGLVTDELISNVLVTAEVKGNKMSFDEFVEVLEELQDMADGDDEEVSSADTTRVIDRACSRCSALLLLYLTRNH